MTRNLTGNFLANITHRTSLPEPKYGSHPGQFRQEVHVNQPAIVPEHHESTVVGAAYIKVDDVSSIGRQKPTCEGELIDMFPPMPTASITIEGTGIYLSTVCDFCTIRKHYNACIERRDEFVRVRAESRKRALLGPKVPYKFFCWIPWPWSMCPLQRSHQNRGPW
ncbi:uncharacterized protein BT62DRAFT_404779 [Guyanagaster necrorhizus]|uniref:Uncharacterized protein n=1 Tax=Guyanagaster necrorhizus TaxID=856835 RepID=A0A9P7W2F9_9AGAR|nr:uncharacterized protein BT62DRAFT_404779 [Guyanagaster necrorhizus MCA 3950]KAG7451180.1 hypothetical protein BT62DRAFT_404779 [Guyanagaster necrorhizus MCA 3950]